MNSACLKSGAIALAVLAFSAGLAAAQTSDSTAAFGANMAKAATVGAAPALLALTAPPPPQMTADQQVARLQAYLAQAPETLAGAPQMTPPPGSLAVTGTPAAGATPDKATIDTILAMGPPDTRAAVPTEGLAAGQAIHPFLPAADDFGHQAAQAVVAAFQAPKGQNPNGKTADDAAQAAAAATPDDPAFDERVQLATTLFEVDGTEAVIRHYVATQHMKLIITEVANHIDIAKLSESDKYRLASIAAVAQTELEDKIIAMNARVQAANLTRAELMQLIVAYDSDAQRKQTRLRLNDTGKEDQLAGIDVIIAEYTVLRDFIAAE